MAKCPFSRTLVQTDPIPLGYSPTSLRGKKGRDSVWPETSLWDSHGKYLPPALPSQLG